MSDLKLHKKLQQINELRASGYYSREEAVEARLREIARASSVMPPHETPPTPPAAPALLPAKAARTIDTRDYRLNARKHVKADADWLSCVRNVAIIDAANAILEQQAINAAKHSGHAWIGERVVINHSLTGRPVPQRNYVIVGVSDRVLVQHDNGSFHWRSIGEVASDLDYAGRERPERKPRLLTRAAVQQAIDSVIDPDDYNYSVSVVFSANPNSAYWSAIVVNLVCRDINYTDKRVFHIEDTPDDITGACRTFLSNAAFERDYQAAKAKQEADKRKAAVQVAKPQAKPAAPLGYARYKCRMMPVVCIEGEWAGVNISTSSSIMIKWVKMSEMVEEGVAA